MPTKPRSATPRATAIKPRSMYTAGDHTSPWVHKHKNTFGDPVPVMVYDLSGPSVAAYEIAVANALMKLDKDGSEVGLTDFTPSDYADAANAALAALGLVAKRKGRK